MKLKLYSHASETSRVLDVNSREDLLKIAEKYPAVKRQIEQAPSTEDGLRILAKYLGRNHIDASIEPDKDKIEDDFNVSSRRPKEIKDLNDAARLLESDVEDLDMPDEVAIQGATHRWE